MLRAPVENEWKTRYLEAIEELEEKERSWSQLEALLRRSVSRLAIAASEIDPRIDDPLEGIRKAVRDRVDPARLEFELDRLSRAVTELELRAPPPEVPPTPGGGAELSARFRQFVTELPIPADQSAALLERLQRLPHPTLEAALAEVQTGLSRWLGAQWKSGLAGTALEPLLLGLIERLETTIEMGESLVPVRARLDGGVNDEDWVDVLEELADVITSGVCSMRQQRRELEELFEHVAERLSHIQTFVEFAQDDLQASQDSRTDFERSVNDHVAVVRDSVDETADVQSLKQQIQECLDRIGEQLSVFKAREEDRVEEASRQNRRLARRVNDLEFETGALRERCRQQQSRLMLDPLTQVYSRYAYERRAEEECRRAQRYQRPLSFVIWDIDHFKSVNDSYGHRAGDRALRKLAQFVRSRVRESDFLARVGGEEFVILFPDLGLEPASRAVEKLRMRVERAGFNYRGERVPITISCGLTELRPGDDPESVYERADRALYRAKGGGRNRCEVL